MANITNKEYGFPIMFKDDPKLDFYVLSNEDIGFIANLVVGTNNYYQFALPYPADWDIDDDSMVLHRIEFLFGSEFTKDSAEQGEWFANQQGLNIFLAMVPEEFSDDLEGFADAEDEEFKSQFAGPMFIGQPKIYLTEGTILADIWTLEHELIQAIYTPPKPLDLKMPMYITLINDSYQDTSEEAVAAAFTKFECVMIRVWYHLRKLTPVEKQVRDTQMLWVRPGS